MFRSLLPLSFSDDAYARIPEFRLGLGFISTGFFFSSFFFLLLLRLPFSYPTIILDIKKINPTNNNIRE